MIPDYAQTDIFSPIWGDYFAGGAGASTGIACAVGEPAYFAVNHSPAALDMYRQNHPHTRLYCEDVFDVDPVEICEGHPMWLLWASPDCTHHSKARGGKPYSKAEKVARCGNAVCPAVSEALVRANFPERCIKEIVSMAALESLVAV